MNPTTSAGRPPIRSVGVALTMTVLAGAAAAQDIAPQPARLLVGPLRLTPRLVIQDLGVDSNIYNASVSPQSDFVFTLTPSIDVAAQIRRAAFTLTSANDFLYFANHTAERAMNHRLAASARVDSRRFGLFAHSSYRNARGRGGDEIDARTRQTEFTGEAGVRFALFAKLAGQVSRRELQIEFDPDAIFDGTRLAEQLNHRESLVTASLRYPVTPLTAIVLSGESGRTRFWLSPSRDAETRSASVGLELHRRALIAGQARIGYQTLKPRTGAFQSFEGLVSSVNVSYRSPGSMTLGLGIDRLPTYSYFEGEPYYVVTSYRASVRRPLSERVEVDVSARRARHEYRQAVPASPQAATVGSLERIREDAAGLTFRVGPTTSVRAGVSYWRRRSDDRDYRNFHGVRAGLTWTFGF